MQYNWQLPDWPDFRFDLQQAEDALLQFERETGDVSGMLRAMPDNEAQEAITQTLIAEAIKTSAIEGEFFSRKDVVSSIKNRLGLNVTPENVKDKKAQGAAELVVDVRNSYAEPLTEDKLFEWHKALLKQSKHINTGAWRKDDEPTQVISGTIGRETIHFEAPPSARVPEEMNRFINWFNDTAPGGKREIRNAPIRSAIAHLYFESIHPFEDGNGRIGRAIAEKALSQTIGRPVLLSLSATIERNKKDYYAAFATAQKSNDITDWVIYFTQVILQAQHEAKSMIELTLSKTKFFDRYKGSLNERQLKAINKMLEALPEGFEGGMTAKKYMSITRASKATATRDLQELSEKGVLLSQGGGRSIHYNLNI
ncbi:Fic family protein [Pseudobacter ginsenosidimutans]|nr:Fic family protein [Pseudobacter ginsenosidimutans]QEC41893.1 Fic family protein [Pseudobacter ginsenosidimutans]